MLHQLRSRLIKANVTDVNFIVITSSQSPLTASVEELRRAAKGVPVHQRAAVSSSWNNILEEQQNNILVIDRCGRLSYQVVMPWSILHYPYVKAAILSTSKDTPCGPCEEHLELNQNSLFSEEERPSSFGVVESKLSSIVKNSYYPPMNSSNINENLNRTSVKPVTESTNTSSFHSSKTTPPTDLSEIETNRTKSLTAAEKVEPLENKKHKHQGANKKIDTSKSKHAKKKNKNGKKTRIESVALDHKATDITKHDSESQIIANTDDELNTRTHLNETNMNMIEDDEDNYDPRVTLSPLVVLPDGRLPMRVIMHAPHTHNGIEEEYLEKQLGNPRYHGHLDEYERRVEANKQAEFDEGFETRNDTKEAFKDYRAVKKDGATQLEEEEVLENILSEKENKVVTEDIGGNYKAVIDAVMKEEFVPEFNHTNNETEKEIKVKVEEFVTTVLGRKEMFLEDVLFSKDETSTTDGNDWPSEEEEDEDKENGEISFDEGKRIPWDDAEYTMKTPEVVDYWSNEENRMEQVKSDGKNIQKNTLLKNKNKLKQMHKDKGHDGKKYKIIEGDEIVEESEEVERKKVPIKPKQHDSMSSSSEESTNERVKAHYSQILPWVNFKI